MMARFGRPLLTGVRRQNWQLASFRPPAVASLACHSGSWLRFVGPGSAADRDVGFVSGPAYLADLPEAVLASFRRAASGRDDAPCHWGMTPSRIDEGFGCQRTAEAQFCTLIIVADPFAALEMLPVATEFDGDS